MACSVGVALSMGDWGPEPSLKWMPARDLRYWRAPWSVEVAGWVVKRDMSPSNRHAYGFAMLQCVETHA